MTDISNVVWRGLLYRPVVAVEVVCGKDNNSNEGADDNHNVLITMKSRTDWLKNANGSPLADVHGAKTVMLHEIYTRCKH